MLIVISQKIFYAKKISFETELLEYTNLVVHVKKGDEKEAESLFIFQTYGRGFPIISQVRQILRIFAKLRS